MVRNDAIREKVVFVKRKDLYYRNISLLNLEGIDT